MVERNHLIIATPIPGQVGLFSIDNSFDFIDEVSDFGGGSRGLGGVNTSTKRFCPENLKELIEQQNAPLSEEVVEILAQATLGVATVAEL